VLAGLKKSRAKLLDIINRHSEEELFTKKVFAWTGTTSLASYAISAGPSHYQWAIDLIKKWKKGGK
jgi:hypothetical protein